MRQMNEVYDFIGFRNQIHGTIERLYRIDVRNYPEISVREALLNLLVHRDYFMAGISICRNQDLANVFYRLHLIEAYGFI